MVSSTWSQREAPRKGNQVAKTLKARDFGKFRFDLKDDHWMGQWKFAEGLEDRGFEVIYKGVEMQFPRVRIIEQTPKTNKFIQDRRFVVIAPGGLKVCVFYTLEEAEAAAMDHIDRIYKVVDLTEEVLTEEVK